MKSSNETLAAAMDILARDIKSDDGVANAAIAEAAQRIRELAAEVEKLRAQIPKWMPIESTRAGSNTPVLIISKEGRMEVAYREPCCDGDWAHQGGDLLDFCPTHWMPAPPAPNKEDEA